MESQNLLEPEVTRMLVGQFLVTVIISTALLVMYEQHTALSGFYGGLVAMVLSWRLGSRIKRLGQRLQDQASVHSAVLALGFAPRLIMVLALFLLGIMQFGLNPMIMALAFSATYIVHWVAFYRARRI